eukprot:gene17599-778_t
MVAQANETKTNVQKIEKTHCDTIAGAACEVLKFALVQCPSKVTLERRPPWAAIDQAKTGNG